MPNAPDHLTVTATLDSRGRMTLPDPVRNALHLEAGQVFELQVIDDHTVTLSVQALIPRDQEWFWTERWQRMEREADEDIAAGRVARFDSTDDFIASLDGE